MTSITIEYFVGCREADAGKVPWVHRAKANMQQPNNEIQEANTFLPVTVAQPVVTTTTSPVNCSALTVELSCRTLTDQPVEIVVAL